MNYKLQCVNNNRKKNINIRILLQQKKLFPLIIHSMLIQIKTFTIIKKFKEKKLKTIEAIIDKCFVQTTFFSLFNQNFDNSRNCNKRAKNKLLRSFLILSEDLKIYRREYIFEKFNIWTFKFNRIVIRKRNWKRNLS